MIVTDPAFQFDILELKLDAHANIATVFVTELRSQFERLELKLDAP